MTAIANLPTTIHVFNSPSTGDYTPKMIAIQFASAKAVDEYLAHLSQPGVERFEIDEMPAILFRYTSDGAKANPKLKSLQARIQTFATACCVPVRNHVYDPDLHDAIRQTRT